MPFDFQQARPYKADAASRVAFVRHHRLHNLPHELYHVQGSRRAVQLAPAVIRHNDAIHSTVNCDACIARGQDALHSA